MVIITNKGMMRKLLFVCEMNMQRSPTFEKWFRENTLYEVKSCGTQFGSEVEVTKELLDWADMVFTMDLRQEISIIRDFPRYCNKVETIGVSDDYTRNSPQLISLIEYWFEAGGL